MGTQIGALLTKNPITYEELSGKVIAIDAYNTIYQFLSAIRQRDGSLLTDSSGNPTSHLTGLFSRTSKLRDSSIKPVFIFDGKPPDMKRDTLDKRKECKQDAARKYEIAKDEGNIENMKKYAQGTSRITPQILEESKKILDLMGIPYVQAESEAEAQAAFMVTRGDADSVGSQDYDSFLFGAENVVRNMGSSGKRKVPGKKAYISITPEDISLSESLANLELTREQLIDMSICIGTDFNEGIYRVGAKTALKLIQKHENIDTIIRKEDKDIRSEYPVEEIRNFFLDPPVTSDYDLKWKKPRSNDLFDYLVNERDFSEKLVNGNTKTLMDAVGGECQSCLDNW